METTTFTQTYRIPDDNLTELFLQIKRLNKRAAKLGVALITLQIDHEHEEFVTYPKDEEHPYERTYKYVPVTIAGETPRLAGWQFAATLQHLEEAGGNILRTVPGFEIAIPEQYRTAASDCDHCRQYRNRLDTYLCYHAEEQRFVQVGSNCIKDFLGHADPHALAEWLQGLSALVRYVEIADDTEADQGNSYGGCGSTYLRTIRVLEYTAAAIRLDGWVSRSKAREQEHGGSTANTVAWLCGPDRTANDEIEKRKYEPTDDDKALAAEALAWSRDVDGSSDYLWNLRIACGQDAIDHRLLGIVCSAISAYQRDMGKIAAKKTEALVSQHQGTIGKRESFTLTLTRAVDYGTMYGTVTFNIFKDSNGNVFVWKQSGAGDLYEGKTYQIKATVKDHNERDGVKQTLITRAKVEKEIDETVDIAQAA